MYPRCLVIADEKTLPNLAWFASRYLTSVCPLCQSTHSAWVMVAGRGRRAASNPCWARALEAREGQIQSVLSVGDISVVWRKETFYLRGCASSRSRSLPAHPPHAGEGPARFPSVMGVGPPWLFLKEYLLAWYMQVLSVSVQTYHSQVLGIKISRWTFFSLFQDFSSWWLMSNVFW